jgi:nascent polypeptide-associated complex subunit beta
MPSQLITLLTLPLLVSAHFELLFPTPRGDDDAEQATFPCGGYEQTQNRTPVALTSIPLSMNLGHTESIISVFLAIGNEVGSSFNYELQPSIQEFGPGEFCWAGVPVPSTLNITEGTNATVQVMTNAHSGGGLYNVGSNLYLSFAY